MNTPPRVLVADDEPNAVILLRRIMEREGFAVDDVHDGASALKKAAECDYDLILLDVMMPGMDGFEVVAALRQNEHTARVPVIFITARAKEPTDVEHGLGIGADDYVRKPFSPRELAARAHSKIKAFHLEENLRRRTQELEGIIRIGAVLNQVLDLDTLLQQLLTALADEIPCHNSAVLLYDEGQHLRRWRFLHPPPDSVEPGALAQTLAALLRDAPDAGWANDPEALGAHVLSLGYCAALWATLYHHGNRVGTLALASREAGVYNEHHLRLLTSVGHEATLAIRNAELYAQLREHAASLEQRVEERTAALKAAQEELIRSEKLASLGRLSASIAHEVNNPLQAIRNCLEMAIEDAEAGEAVDKEMLQVAEQHVRRISDTTTRLLSFARPGTEERREVDLVALIHDTLTLTRRQIERAGVTLETNLSPLPPVIGNADQLRQVILNMVLNAIEAMPDGGTLRVSAMSGEHRVIVAFADTGVGIAPEDRPRLFEPFFSTKRDGTGLGLSVSYGIIDAHGGSIEVETEPGKGSTFAINLPVLNTKPADGA